MDRSVSDQPAGTGLLRPVCSGPVCSTDTCCASGGMQAWDGKRGECGRGTEGGEGAGFGRTMAPCAARVQRGSRRVAELSHLTEDGAGELIGPTGALAFPPDRDVWPGGAKNVEGERPAARSNERRMVLPSMAITPVPVSPNPSRKRAKQPAKAAGSAR
jgi:hypothetical protein